LINRKTFTLNFQQQHDNSATGEYHVSKECSVIIRLSVLLKLAYLSQKARAHKPRTDIMGFLEGKLHREKSGKLKLDLTGCHPVLESEFMEKAFPDEVFRKGKELCATLDRAKAKGDSKEGRRLLGWYHTHTKPTAAMSVMDRINHISLLDLMVADENGGLQGTLKDIYQGEEAGSKTKGESGKESSEEDDGIIGEDGVALVYCPGLQEKGKALKDYLKVYAFSDSGMQKDLPISDFTELTGCRLENDLDGCLETMAKLGRLAASQPVATEEKASFEPEKKQARRTRAKTGSLAKGKTRASKTKGKGKKKRGGRKPLDRAGLEVYINKEAQVKKRLDKVEAMVQEKKNVATITTKLKETRVYLDKLSSSLEKEQKLLMDAKDPDTVAVRRDFEELVMRLRRHSTELEKIIAEMYYKVLGDLSDEGALPPQE
jgi:hypothetical protein